MARRPPGYSVKLIPTNGGDGVKRRTVGKATQARVGGGGGRKGVGADRLALLDTAHAEDVRMRQARAGYEATADANAALARRLNAVFSETEALDAAILQKTKDLDALAARQENADLQILSHKKRLEDVKQEKATTLRLVAALHEDNSAAGDAADGRAGEIREARLLAQIHADSKEKALLEELDVLRRQCFRAVDDLVASRSKAAELDDLEVSVEVMQRSLAARDLPAAIQQEHDAGHAHLAALADSHKAAVAQRDATLAHAEDVNAQVQELKSSLAALSPPSSVTPGSSLASIPDKGATFGSSAGGLIASMVAAPPDDAPSLQEARPQPHPTTFAALTANMSLAAVPTTPPQPVQRPAGSPRTAPTTSAYTAFVAERASASKPKRKLKPKATTSYRRGTYFGMYSTPDSKPAPAAVESAPARSRASALPSWKATLLWRAKHGNAQEPARGRSSTKGKAKLRRTRSAELSVMEEESSDLGSDSDGGELRVRPTARPRRRTVRTIRRGRRARSQEAAVVVLPPRQPLGIPTWKETASPSGPASPLTSQFSAVPSKLGAYVNGTGALPVSPARRHTAAAVASPHSAPLKARPAPRRRSTRRPPPRLAHSNVTADMLVAPGSNGLSSAVSPAKQPPPVVPPLALPNRGKATFFGLHGTSTHPAESEAVAIKEAPVKPQQLFERRGTRGNRVIAAKERGWNTSTRVVAPKGPKRPPRRSDLGQGLEVGAVPVIEEAPAPRPTRAANPALFNRLAKPKPGPRKSVCDTVFLTGKEVDMSAEALAVAGASPPEAPPGVSTVNVRVARAKHRRQSLASSVASGTRSPAATSPLVSPRVGGDDPPELPSVAASDKWMWALREEVHAKRSPGTPPPGGSRPSSPPSPELRAPRRRRNTVASARDLLPTRASARLVPKPGSKPFSPRGSTPEAPVSPAKPSLTPPPDGDFVPAVGADARWGSSLRDS